jgi:hypothetical protein
MKMIGVIAFIIGAIWIIFAINIDVTVPAGELGRVNNIGLMNDKQNNIIIGGFLIIAGGIITGFASLRNSSNLAAKNSPPTLPSAPVEPPCERDLTLDAYKLWLVSRFNIQRNEVLGSFVCEDTIHSSLDGALEFAHSIEQKRVAEIAEQKAAKELAHKRFEADFAAKRAAEDRAVRKFGPMVAIALAAIIGVSMLLGYIGEQAARAKANAALAPLGIIVPSNVGDLKTFAVGADGTDAALCRNRGGTVVAFWSADEFTKIFEHYSKALTSAGFRQDQYTANNSDDTSNIIFLKDRSAISAVNLIVSHSSGRNPVDICVIRDGK